jgi:hypothetical protein
VASHWQETTAGKVNIFSIDTPVSRSETAVDGRTSSAAGVDLVADIISPHSSSAAFTSGLALDIHPNVESAPWMTDFSSMDSYASRSEDTATVMLSGKDIVVMTGEDVDVVRQGPGKESAMIATPTVSTKSQAEKSPTPTKVKLKSSEVSIIDKKKSNQKRKYFDAGNLKLWMRGVGLKASRQLAVMFSEDEDVPEETEPLKGSHDIDPDMNQIEGVGKLHVYIDCATRYDVVDAADGDHYVQFSIENTGLTGPALATMHAKTRTIRDSAAPHFSKQWTFTVPHFKCSLKMSLINARDDSVVGSHSMSLYALMMRDADAHVESLPETANDTYLLYNSKLQSSAGSSAHTLQTARATANLKARIKFEENFQALYINFVPFAAPSGPEDEFSVERLSKHVARFQAAINIFVLIYTEYCRLMNWDDSLFTGLCFVLFVYTTLTVNAEYALCCPMFVVVVFATIARYRRMHGYYRKALLENNKYFDPIDRPVANLRLCLLDWRMGAVSSTPSKRPYIRASFVPMTELGLTAATSNEYHREHFIGVLGSDASSNAGNSSQSLFGLLGDDSNAKDRECVIQNLLDPVSKAGLEVGGEKGIIATTDKEVVTLVYPVLQSVNASSQLVPWQNNTGRIKLAVFREKPSSLTSTYYGSISVSVKDVAGAGNVLSGWCKLQTGEPVQVEMW